MAREYDFHNLIEKQDPEGKEEQWKRIGRDCSPENFPARSFPVRKRFFVKRTAVSVASVFVVAVVLSVGIPKFINKEETGRYCTQADYNRISVGKTIKDYSQEIDTDLLFFDWYEKTDGFVDYEYRLNDNDELICFEEQIFDDNGNLLKIYLTDTRTEIDVLNEHNKICVNRYQIKEIGVRWGADQFVTYARLEYNNYRYYINSENPDGEYMLSLLGTLLTRDSVG